MTGQHLEPLAAAYHASENVGYPIEPVSGSRMAMFSGSFGNDYQKFHAKDLMTMPKGHATGTGPSAHVDTACSSSLMALHLACQFIRNGESSLQWGFMAIIGLGTVLAIDNLGILSKDSRSFSFDERRNGYGRGEGVGSLIVRPLGDAIANGDNIRALIRSTGSNQDGKTPAITKPSMERQEGL
ncbi:hypothetical protein ASPBRDRAFT_52229 [Aspergillus brasiliensis CBS 101740]|uniref:Ketosynthase family 3 (KS3) domain-containing protein n=1 Tax=Aspergillus brasiliensis (strain CBS 101740 / IMI 381727 / IBT 21946) TaxID=767769 RepID=A0A1L9UY93_ASPBC|nr:hypothetical protein ASPBRDRAFT_52229 [Aspergillus brasiliensis CBS 101740]